MKVKLIDLIRAEQALQSINQKGTDSLVSMARIKVTAGNIVGETMNDKIESIQHVISARREKLLAFESALRESIDVRGKIRAIVGRANAKTGIDTFMTERAVIDQQIRIAGLMAAVSVGEPNSTRATVVDIENRAAAQRSGNVYNVDTSAMVDLLTADDTASLASVLAAFKKKALTIKDEIERLNRSTSVEVDDALWVKAQALVDSGLPR